MSSLQAVTLTKEPKKKVPSLLKRLASRTKKKSSTGFAVAEKATDSPAAGAAVKDEPSPCQKMEADGTLPQPQGTAGKRITILSIDGGGVRGVIATVLLEYLESQLQHLDGKDARIADYFDVVAGTSTGGLVASMLTAPDENNRPLMTASQATDFYMSKAITVFPQNAPPLSGLKNLFSGPKYSNTPLKKLMVENFKEHKIADALTDVLITSFDVKNQQPVFFDRAVAQRTERFNAKFVDACLGTSAAPTYLPAYKFVVPDKDNPGPAKTHEYNLIDGGVAANNPTQVAVLHSLKDLMIGDSPHKERIPCFEGYKNLLVLSLGTGVRKESFDAGDMAGWGTISWVANDGRTPIVDMLMNSSAYLVDFDVAIRFQTEKDERNYLRIQAYNISDDMARLDNADPKNMAKLKQLAKDLLDQHALYRDAVNGELVDKPYVSTNREALSCFAKWLSEEKKGRSADVAPSASTSGGSYV